MSMYRVDNLTMVISEIISFSYLEVHCTKEEATGGRNRFWQNGETPSTALEELFLPFRNRRRYQNGDSGHFLRESEGEIKVGLFVCEGRLLPSLKYFV